jgi:hypothetical protein
MPRPCIVCAKDSLLILDERERGRSRFLVVEHINKVADNEWDSEV